jgi:hypothetical protein
MTDLRRHAARDVVRITAVLGVLTLPLAACDVDSLLDIEDPDIVNPNVLADSASLPAFRAAAIGDFSVAYDDDDSQITYSGMLADEWINSETFDTRIEIDLRRISEDNSNVQEVTRNLYRARTTAESAAEAYERFEPVSEGHAEVLSLAGLTYTLFAENYCSGVPFSRLTPEGTFEFGKQETTEEILSGDERALGRFDEALEVATAAEAEEQTYLAQVGKGRVLLDLGRYQEAADAVAGVPTDFAYVIAHSENTTREQNGVFTFNVISERVSVADREGGNGLPYRENYLDGDPRTPWERTPDDDVGFDRSTPQYNNLKYASRSAETPVATGVEARLIEAEAALAAGDVGTFRAKLNEARAEQGVTPLEAADIPATAEGRVDLLFQERGYGLWLTSHRLGDLRRLIRQYGRDQSEVFPVGEYHKDVQGGVYGDDVNLLISVDERNNTEFSGIPTNQSLCLDREA